MAENKLEIDILLNDKDALNRLKTAMRGVETESKKSTDSMNLSWAGFAAKLFVVEQAMGPVLDFMKDAVRAANEQEDAIQRLNTALQLQGTFTKELSSRYQAMAAELQRSSRFGDEAIEAVQQRLVTLGNVAPQSMERTTKAVLDLAAALKIDLETASTLVAKASQGETAALSRYGLAISEVIPKGQRFEALLGMIEKRMGGAAQADVATFAGKQAQLGHAFGDLMEELGAFVTKSPLVVAGMDAMAKGAARLAESLHHVNDEEEVSARMRENLAKLRATPDMHNFLQREEEAGMPSSESNFRRGIIPSPDEQAQIDAELKTLMQQTSDTKSNALMLQEQSEVEARQRYILGEVDKVDQLRIVWDQWNNEKTQMAMTQVQAETDFLTVAIQTQQLAHESMWKTVGKLRDNFQSGISDMFKSMIRGTFDAGEAFKQLGLKMVDTLIDYGTQLAVNMALSKLFSTQQVAVSTVTAGAVAAAWAPAAAAASLATVGGNSAAAAAALTTTHALSRALSAVPGLAEGGDVVSGGAVLVGERGPEFLNLPSGARVTPLDKAGNGGGLTVHINFNGNIMGSQEAAREFAREIAGMVSSTIDAERERL